MGYTEVLQEMSDVIETSANESGNLSQTDIDYLISLSRRAVKEIHIEETS